MKEHSIGLTTPEMSSLWKSYMQNTAVLCVVKHFQQHVEDSEIRPILKEQSNLLQEYINKIKKIFKEEEFPIPQGFSDDDVDLSAPRLYTDLYALSFVYRFNQVAVSDYATIFTKVSRTDVVDYFHKCLESSTQLYRKALSVMLSKGIYDRPPKIPYPDKVEFVEKQHSLIASWFGENTPLSAFELGEIFYAIERNYIGMLLLMGFIQVVKDKHIREYLIKGKDLSQKQIDTFNEILKKEDHLGTIPLSMEVTSSTVSPFSDRLMMFLVSITTSSGIFLLAYSISVSMRKDLITDYSLFMTEIMKYSGEGVKMLIDRGWMEKPPQAPDRKALYMS